MEIIGRLFSLFGVKKRMEAPSGASGALAFGSFSGVFLPSALSIFGVIMYLRLGMIVGKTGIIATLVIIGFSSLITLLAALSISSIATNRQIHKGGAYYIISRSLGIDFGAAIGIPLYLAQAIGIAFYIMGFSETLHGLIPHFDPTIISLSTLAILGLIAFFSTNVVMKAQLLIFLLIMGSLVSLFLGNSAYKPPSFALSSSTLSFWAAFAIFFPAVTGIEAGISLSGMLKNPSRSLPIGTLAAVFLGFLVYSAMAVFLWFYIPCSVLAENMMVCKDIARWGSLIVVGICGATLSSALGAIVAAPRTLQAIAEDGVVFRFLSKEQGKHREPRSATLCTLLLAALFIAIGNIDKIAPILTMFFLISYGMLNLVCGLEALLANPSWRPTFAIPVWVSFAGALLCLIAMLMINAGATMVSLVVVLIIYFFRGRKLNSRWDDICFGVLMFIIKSTAYRLKNAEFAARSWRPHLLIFSPSITLAPDLMDFISKLTRNKSFLTFACLIKSQSPYNISTVAKAINSSIKKYKIQAFVKVEKVKNTVDGYHQLVLAHGIGPLTHNTVVLVQEGEEEYQFFPEVIRNNYKIGKNTLVFRSHAVGSKEDHAALSKMKTQRQIDVWWDLSDRKSCELLLVLAHMVQAGWGIKKTTITIKSIVSCEQAKEQRLNYFVDLFAKSRIPLSYVVYVAQEEEVFKTISYFSQKADFTFAGLPVPSDEIEPAEYRRLYIRQMKALQKLPKAAFVVAAEPLNFEEIFR